MFHLFHFCVARTHSLHKPNVAIHFFISSLTICLTIESQHIIRTNNEQPHLKSITLLCRQNEHFSQANWSIPKKKKVVLPNGQIFEYRLVFHEWNTVQWKTVKLKWMNRIIPFSVTHFFCISISIIIIVKLWGHLLKNYY